LEKPRRELGLTCHIFSKQPKVSVTNKIVPGINAIQSASNFRIFLVSIEGPGGTPFEGIVPMNSKTSKTKNRRTL
jgi:hypothetical protein